MAYVKPDVDDFKELFTRDFPFGESSEFVMDSDITRAYGEVDVNLNEGLYEDQASFTLSYLYLAAHFLVMDLRASSQGIQGSYAWMTSGKSVGSVSESYAIPDKILANPYYAMLSKTNYGAKFLMMLMPRLVGQIYVVAGGVRP